MVGKTCKISECTRCRAKRSGTNDLARYCKGHLCQTSRCEMNKALGHRHCTDHKCADPRCPASKARHSVYCKKHSRCGVLGCSIVLDISREISLPAYCPNHRCVTPGCTEPRTPAGVHCRQCLSRVQRCLRCGHPDPLNHHCPVQRCQWLKCLEPAQAEGRCKNHQPCLFKGCKKLADRRTSDGDVYEFCDSHNYCYYCKRLKEASKWCCSQCACEWKYCDLPKDRHDNKDNRWCRVHTCGHRGCGSMTIIDADEKKFKFCIRHNCTTKGCTAEVAGKGKFCGSHTCKSSRCTDAPVDGHELCAYHECKEPGCPKEARLPGAYCFDAAIGAGHACREPGCAKKAGVWEGANSAYNWLCGNHAIENATTDATTSATNDMLRLIAEQQEQEEKEEGYRHRARNSSPPYVPQGWPHARRRGLRCPYQF